MTEWQLLFILFAGVFPSSQHPYWVPPHLPTGLGLGAGVGMTEWQLVPY
jgi:hypothetical protein